MPDPEPPRPNPGRPAPIRPAPLRPDGLQLDENRRFQEWFWTAQRCAWGVFLLIALITATGLSGRGGTLATGHTRIGTADVTWPRITRRGVPETLTIRLPTPQTAPEITVTGGLHSLFQIEQITPRPAMESGGDPLRLAFFPDPSARNTLRLSLRSQSAGIATYAIGIGGDQTTLTTYVLP